jgi:DNA-binding PadR family transcriptional regulator
MGMKLLKSKRLPRRTQYYRGRFVSALHKLEAEGILDVEIEKVDNRMRKYYKLTERETVTDSTAELEDFIRTCRV